MSDATDSPASGLLMTINSCGKLKFTFFMPGLKFRFTNGPEIPVVRWYGWFSREFSEVMKTKAACLAEFQHAKRLLKLVYLCATIGGLLLSGVVRVLKTHPDSITEYSHIIIAVGMLSFGLLGFTQLLFNDLHVTIKKLVDLYNTTPMG